MDRFWQQRYPQGVPYDINPDEYPSLLEVVDRTIEQYPDKPAFINMGATLTFRQLDEMSRYFAAYLQNGLGLSKGDRVAIMLPNLLQYPVALFGILKAGMVVVNVNPLYTPRELRHQLQDSGAKAILILSNFAHTLEKVVGDTPVEHVILSNIGDMLAMPKRTMVNFVVKYIKKMVPYFNLPDATSFRRVIKKGANLTYVRPDVTGDDLAFLQYTGGTTGVAKGAMLTHRNMVANLTQAHAFIGVSLNEGKEFIVTPLPLYHIFALTVNCLLFLKLGCPNLLITNPRDIPGFIKEIKKYPFTGLSGVNTLFNALLNDPEFETLDFSRLKLTVSGGMATQHAVAEKWMEVTGQNMMQGYGLTECCPGVSFTPADLERFNGSIGLPICSTDIRLVDKDGMALGVGGVGELQVKGPQVMAGYWQRPEATAEVICDGWLSTGDVARMDEEGFLYIVDRKKDMIIVSGFNVFPNEIEDVVASHPGVLECAAIGVPSAQTGEAVKLFIVKKDHELIEDEVVQFCRKNLTAYKVPKLVEFRDDLPKTNVGKILRRELRVEEESKLKSA